MTWSPAGPADDHTAIVEGLAAIASTLAEMGTSDDEALAQLRAWIVRLNVNAATIRDAATAMSSMPQPLEETAEQTERARPIREMLGVTSAAEELAAALRAREWLEQLAGEASST